MNTQQQYRKVMGRFATGVSIIAVGVDTEVRAITANSVTSISLDPPVLLFGVKNESRLLAAVQQQRAFSVNFLAAHQMDLSAYYAGAKTEASPDCWCSDQGQPTVREALAALVCDVADMHKVGDHTVVYGNVKSMVLPDQSRGALVYLNGRYRFLEECH